MTYIDDNDIEMTHFTFSVTLILYYHVVVENTHKYNTVQVRCSTNGKISIYSVNYSHGSIYAECYCVEIPLLNRFLNFTFE